MAKKLYLFMLGRDPELTHIEIESFFSARNIPFKVLQTSPTADVVELEGFPPEMIEEFGGVIKVAEVICNTNKIEIIENELAKVDFYAGTKNKITYFLDVYETDIDDFVKDYLKDYFKSIRLKAIIKKESSPSRLVKKNTLTEGLEIVVFRNYIARTVAIANPLELRARDLGRPRADYLKTISLRLAKILINLSKVKPGELLLDPFCGSGGILQEAVLKGIHVIGSDRDKVAIEESRFNMEWLEKRYPLKAKWRLIKNDATKISESIKRIDGVATEPYLGPYIRRMPNLFQAKGMISELRVMYDAVLKQFSIIVKKSGCVAIIVPRFKTTEGKTVTMDFQNIAEANNFIITAGPVLYAYKDSKLIREIYVLERK